MVIFGGFLFVKFLYISVVEILLLILVVYSCNFGCEVYILSDFLDLLFVVFLVGG